MWKANILTLFPEMFPGPLAHSITGRALGKLWDLEAFHLRSWALDKHQTTDEPPYGGGAGMVIRADVVGQALDDVSTPDKALVYMTPRGTTLTQTYLKQLHQQYPAGATLLCGRYEGIDERAIEYGKEQHSLIEVSLGDYILTGGELAAMMVIDAWARLIPGVVGCDESVISESFELDVLEFSHYTRPRVWRGREVPDVLLSGDHGRIAAWREQEQKRITAERRPDLNRTKY